MDDLPAESNRRLESAIRLGTIAEVDPSAARARARSGGILTNWLPWIERRSGETADWDPPTPGEQCLILSPSGEPGAGVLLTGISRSAFPPPSKDPAKQVRQWPDGAEFSYDHAAHEYRVNVPEGGKIVLVVGGTELELTGSSATIKTEKTTIDAETLITKSLTIAKGLSVEGGGGSGSAIRGIFNILGKIFCNDKDISDRHGHTGVQPGGGTTGPVQ